MRLSHLTVGHIQYQFSETILNFFITQNLSRKGLMHIHAINDGIMNILRKDCL